MTEAKIGWTRLIRVASEGAIIVASILLALAADAWLENRTDRVEEHSEIEGLHEQLLTTRQILREAIETDEEGIANSRELIETLESAMQQGHAPVSDHVLRRFGLTTFFDPPLSRFESIISSGRLSLIRDNSLRAEIADWPNVARRPQFSANSRREMIRTQFIPFLSANHDVDYWLYREAVGESIEVPTDRPLVNVLKARLWLDRVVLFNQRQALEALDDLLAQIESALSHRRE